MFSVLSSWNSLSLEPFTHHCRVKCCIPNTALQSWRSNCCFTKESHLQRLSRLFVLHTATVPLRQWKLFKCGAATFISTSIQTEANLSKQAAERNVNGASMLARCAPSQSPPSLRGLVLMRVSYEKTKADESSHCSISFQWGAASLFQAALPL